MDAIGAPGSQLADRTCELLMFATTCSGDVQDRRDMLILEGEVKTDV